MKIRNLVETAKDNRSRLSPVNPADRAMPASGHPLAVISLKPEEAHQTVIGFGAALTEAAAHVLGQLSPADRERVLADHYGPEGQGYVLARSHLNSCDFSLGHWALVEKAGDIALESFSMAMPDRHLVPIIKDADRLCGGKLHLMVSPWSPPGWMKDNGRMDQGGKLLPQYRAAWADTFVRYLAELRKRGVEVWSLTIQNEPAAVQRWDSCIWSAEEEADFAVDHLKPRLKAAGFGQVKVLVWDHNRELLWERASASYRRPGAAEALDGVTFHWYSGDQYDQVAQVAAAWPDKLLVFSEGCVEGGPRFGAWFTGERYAHNILNDLNHGTHGWIDWNLALDLQGGPNHASNWCDAPVLVDTTAKKAHYQSSFYYMGQISRFVKPGAVRIGREHWVGWVPASPDGRGGGMIESGAFRNPDGSLAVIVMNRSEADLPYLVKTAAGGFEAGLVLPARGIHTLVLGGD
jgi:glucosylceramidase